MTLSPRVHVAVSTIAVGAIGVAMILWGLSVGAPDSAILVIAGVIALGLAAAGCVIMKRLGTSVHPHD